MPLSESYEDLLVKCNAQAVEDAVKAGKESADGGFVPPPNTYTAEVVKILYGTHTKGKDPTEYPSVLVQAMILAGGEDEDLIGKKWGTWFRFGNDIPLGQLIAMETAVLGDQPQTKEEILAGAKQLIGTKWNVLTTERPNEDGTGVWKNTRFLERVTA